MEQVLENLCDGKPLDKIDYKTEVEPLNDIITSSYYELMDSQPKKEPEP